MEQPVLGAQKGATNCLRKYNEKKKKKKKKKRKLTQVNCAFCLETCGKPSLKSSTCSMAVLTSMRISFLT